MLRLPGPRLPRPPERHAAVGVEPDEGHVDRIVPRYACEGVRRLDFSIAASRDSPVATRPRGPLCRAQIAPSAFSGVLP